MRIDYMPKSLEEAEDMYYFQKPDMSFEDFLVLLQEQKDLMQEEEADRDLHDYKSWRYYQ